MSHGSVERRLSLLWDSPLHSSAQQDGAEELVVLRSIPLPQSLSLKKRSMWNTSRHLHLCTVIYSAQSVGLLLRALEAYSLTEFARKPGVTFEDAAPTSHQDGGQLNVAAVGQTAFVLFPQAPC